MMMLTKVNPHPDEAYTNAADAANYNFTDRTDVNGACRCEGYFYKK